MDIHTTYLVEIVHRDSSEFGYCDASGVRSGRVWVNPNDDRVNRVWRVQWPEENTAELISSNNTKRAITNCNLKLADLVLQ